MIVHHDHGVSLGGYRRMKNIARVRYTFIHAALGNLLLAQLAHLRAQQLRNSFGTIELLSMITQELVREALAETKRGGDVRGLGFLYSGYLGKLVHAATTQLA